MKKRLTFVTITGILALAMSGNAFAAGTLSYGDSGNSVYTLQQHLAAYGYFYDEPTGFFGEQTELAVMEFQYDYGLDADGVAGPYTLGYLGIDDYDSYDDYGYEEFVYEEEEESASLAAVDSSWYSDSSLSRALSNGMSGNDVYTLQSLLAEFGYFYDSPTGFFGDMTEAAVKSFQYDYGLSADGIAGSATFRMLAGSDSGYYEEEPAYDYVGAILDAVNYTPAAASGYCASWVSQVLVNAGVLSYYPGYNANDYWANVCYSTDLSDLQPGMVIATKYSNSYLGSIYGHVGIYIGDGMVCSSVGYKETISVDAWISKYNNASMGSYAAWGFAF